MQNVFFLPADFLRLRCSSKRCGRRVLEDLAQMPLSLVTAFKSKAKKKVSVKLTYLQQLRRHRSSTSDECKIHIRETKEEVQDVLN